MAVEHVHGPELATDRTLSKEEALQRDVIEALRPSLAGDRQLTHQLMDRVWSMILGDESVQVALVSWDACTKQDRCETDKVSDPESPTADSLIQSKVLRILQGSAWHSRDVGLTSL